MLHGVTMMQYLAVGLKYQRTVVGQTHFPVYFDTFEIRLQHLSTHRGRKVIEQFLQEERSMADICHSAGTQFQFA